MKTKAIAVTATLLAFSASSTFAAVDSGALAAGHPAGMHQAQLHGGTGMLVVAGAAAIGFAVALATASSGPSAANPGGGSGGSGGTGGSSSSSGTTG